MRSSIHGSKGDVGRRKLRRLWRIALALALLLGCGKDEMPPDALAVIDGQAITEADLLAEIARLPEKSQVRYDAADQRARLLDELITKEILVRAAREGGLDRDPTLEAELEAFERDRLVQAMERAAVEESVSEADVEAFYAANPSEFSREQVRVRHILVRERDLADSLRAELETGADFEALAREHSIDPSRARGGDLGQVPRGRMHPTFERAAFALTGPGELSPVIETRFGFHLIQLIEPTNQLTIPLERARAAIRERLEQEAVARLVESLREEAAISWLSGLPQPG